MCRLYAQISVRPRSAADFLAESGYSLYNQSRLKGREQKDGWGIGWFAGDRARVVKSPRPAFKEPARFRSASLRAVSKIVIGHLRAASNPRGLPSKRLIGVENTQPFTDGRWIFAHNGTINIPDEVTRHLGRYASRVKGLNDSEVYFWQFRKHLDQSGSPAAALRRCIEELWELWEKCRTLHPKEKAPYTGLNTLVTDGRRLTALCHCLAGSTTLSSLYTPGQSWGTMSRTLRDGRLVAASEPMDRGRWRNFRNSEIFEAWVDGARLKTRVVRFRGQGATR